MQSERPGRFLFHGSMQTGFISERKYTPALQEIQVESLGQEDPLEEGMVFHPRILVWRIPWTEESGGLQTIGSRRVGHD